MFRNYIKIALRNLQKNKLHSLFNIIGLSMAVGSCIAVFLFVDLMLDQDTFHHNADKIFMIGQVKLINDREDRWGLTSAGFLEKHWRSLLPDEPFELRFQDQVFERDFKENEEIASLFRYVALMTMCIAAMGLFALVSLNIARRTKEIGIRKVLGASSSHIVQLVNKEFYYLILAAGILIYPLAYILINGLLRDVFQGGYREIDMIPFAGSVIVMMLLAGITVGTRVYRVAVENPVHALKYE